MKKYLIVRNNKLLKQMFLDIKISAFSVIPKKATPSDVSTWAASCTPSISGTIYSMDDLVEAENVKVVIPSVCDGSF
jgi:hypothetical protein